jgi:opacity protein-like surface antigen
MLLRVAMAAGVALAALPASAQLVAPRFMLDGELGAAWQSSNEVQVPNDAAGTRFDFRGLTGDGPYLAGRLTFSWQVAPKHEVRALYAPLGLKETGTLPGPVRFEGQTFNGANVEGEYRFDSYRIGYRYTFFENTAWTWKAGVTGKIRDAEITLRQNGVSASRTDTGFVPLLSLYGEWRFAPRWRGELDLEGLGASQGRAIDLGLRAGYDLTRNWNVGVGYRFLDGGADNDNVYNFARFNYAVATLRYRW